MNKQSSFLRWIPEFDKDQKIIEFSQTDRGRIAIIILFLFFLFLNRSNFEEILFLTIATSVCAYFQSHRKLLLLFFNIIYLLLQYYGSEGALVGISINLIVIALLLFSLVAFRSLKFLFLTPF